MAAPIADKIILPLDTGNTGKKVRSQTRVVGADTVHEHYFVPVSPRSKVGLYVASSGVLTVQASAHNGTTTGFFWLHNPVGSAVKLAVRRINVQSQITTNLATPTAPRLLFSRATFTGTASGTAITPARRDSNDAAPVGSLRTAVTGLTPVLVAEVFAAFPAVMAGTAGWTFTPPAQQEMVPQDEDGYIVLRAGECLICWQPDAGTASDTRKWVVNLAWEEFE